MDEYITSYEYEKNVNPTMTSIPIEKKNIKDCDYGITFVNLSEVFNTSYKCTTPNLLASFIKIKSDDSSTEFSNKSYINGSSHLFYVLQGSCEIFIDNDEHVNLDVGDIMITPCFQTMQIKNIGANELQIYYINDSPLINYLGTIPVVKTFKTAKYSKEYLLKNLKDLSNPTNNRKGILLSNKDTEKLGTNTITPVLWALYNELPPNTIQKPHKHNSVALDLCITCSDSDNIYTLIGDELDESGNILNPIKMHWKEGEMFITPPGLWHSHNNTGETYAYILPIQDAGILLYQRILGIRLS